MSICNVWLDGKRGLVAVDTRVHEYNPSDGTSRKYEGEKSALFGGVVFAARGNLHILHRLVASLHLQAPARVPIDLLAQNLSARLAAVEAWLAADTAGHAAPDGFFGDAGTAEITIAGWCEAQCRVRAFNAEKGAVGWAAQEIPGVMAAPCVGDIPRMGSPPEMHSAAIQQVRDARALHPHAPIGGRLVVYQIGPARVDVVNMGSID